MVVLDKGLEFIVADRIWRPKEGKEIFIPSKAPHRLRCLAKKRARVMELWLGDSDESDIVRFEDKYGRE